VLIIEFIKNLIVVLLTAVQFAMLIRAVLSWFPLDSNKFVDFIHAVTEPFVQPMRLLFEKFNWFQSLPIDVSFLASYIVISMVLMLLP
jgi:uncharacterized protein YggT (Ycf19 family)